MDGISAHWQDIRRNLRYDIPASLVVFLIAMPLSLGIAIASGAPVIAGLVAAAVGGIVAGALGGSVVQVSGPAAGLTVIVADINQQYGWQVTCFITVCAGVLQIALGASRLAATALAVSPAIVHGMLAGVGLTIGLAQLHVVLGGTSQSSAIDNLRALPGQLADHELQAVAVGALTIGLLLVWPRLPRSIRRIPGPLVAVVAATALAELLSWKVTRIDLPDNVLGSITSPALPHGDWQGIAVAILTVALVASVESLLSAVAVDRMHNGPRTRLDRELIGQGAANTVSGALGGYPLTGVIVRSTTNVQAGARSRTSTVLHGVWIVAFVLAFGALLERMPQATLAALLVFVGFRMVSVGHIRQLHRHREIVTYLVTMIAVLALNLLEGVLVGIAVAIVFALRRLSRTTITLRPHGERWRVAVTGSLMFLSVPRLSRALATVPAGADVEIDLNVDFMDHAAFEAIHSWRAGHERQGGRVDIDEVHDDWYEQASAGTPGRDKTRPTVSPRWFAPWEEWQPRPAASNGSTGRGLGLLVRGASDFQRRVAPLAAPTIGRLAADGQRPSHLFIACSDSRLVPNLITGSGPGDLFTLRNVGNLVPAHSDASVAAGVEYAVGELGVDTITVCGHSGCGGMARLAAGIEPGEESEVDRWLRGVGGSLERWHALDGDRTDLDELSRQNVIQQLANLLAYPTIAAKVTAGEVQLVGMFFELRTAETFLLEPASGRFVPIDAPRAPVPVG